MGFNEPILIHKVLLSFEHPIFIRKATIKILSFLLAGHHLTMKYTILLIILSTSITLLNCDDKEQQKRIGKVYNPQKSQFKVKRYFKREKQKGLIQNPRTELGSLIEYYIVYYSRDGKQILKEEHYKRPKLLSIKKFLYKTNNGNSILTKTIHLDGKKRIVKELVYQKGKKSLEIKYSYHPKDKYLMKKEISRHGKPDGQWLYFNASGKEIKKEFYNKGTLKHYWIYQYNKSGDLMIEEHFNNKDQLLYKHSFH